MLGGRKARGEGKEARAVDASMADRRPDRRHVIRTGDAMLKPF